MMFAIRRHSTLLCAALGLLALAACQTTPPPKVQAHYNKAVDFSQYQSFSLTDTPELVLYDDATARYREQFDRAIIEALEKKGYQHVASGGDLFINYRAEVDNQLESFSNAIPITPDRYGYYHSWASLYGPLPQEREGGNTRITYTGALNIDVVDREKNQAIWQGVYQKKITSDQPDDRQRLIDSAVEDVLSNLPRH